MHVSYRKACGLFVIRSGARALAKTCDAGRTFVDVPLILHRWEQRKLRAHRYLWRLFDLFFEEFIKSPESTWETFWTPRRPPGGPQETPRGPPRGAHIDQTSSNSHRTLIKLTSNSHRPHIDLTSNSHRTHIELTSNSRQTHIELTSTSHRTHIELTSNSHRTHREQNLYTNILSGVKLPISRLRRPYVSYTYN